MAINIKMTPIHHEPRQRLGLTLVEYTVAHAVFFASINPKSPVKGWCSYSKKSIAAFVGISERKVFDIVARLEELGLLERHPEMGFTRPTERWFIETEISAEGMQNLQGDPAESAEGGMQNLHTSNKNLINITNTPKSPQGEVREEGVGFDVFWTKYDKKQGKQNATKEWKKLKPHERLAAVAYIPAYFRQHPEKKFRKDPERYLKYKLWTDAEEVAASERKLLGYLQTQDYATLQEVWRPIYEGDEVPRIGFRTVAQKAAREAELGRNL